MNDRPIELVFETSSEKFDHDDDRWIQQTNDLLEQLRRQAGEIQRAGGSPAEGHKGVDLAAVVLALGSSGAIAAAVTIFKAWLGRDQSRVLRFKRKVGDEEEIIEFSGDRVTEQALLDFMKSQGG